MYIPAVGSKVSGSTKSFKLERMFLSSVTPISYIEGS